MRYTSSLVWRESSKKNEECVHERLRGSSRRGSHKKQECIPKYNAPKIWYWWLYEEKFCFTFLLHWKCDYVYVCTPLHDRTSFPTDTCSWVSCLLIVKQCGTDLDYDAGDCCRTENTGVVVDSPCFSAVK